MSKNNHRKYRAVMYGSDIVTTVKVGSNVSKLRLLSVDPLKGDADTAEQEWYYRQLCRRIEPARKRDVNVVNGKEKERVV